MFLSSARPSLKKIAKGITYLSLVIVIIRGPSTGFQALLLLTMVPSHPSPLYCLGLKSCGHMILFLAEIYDGLVFMLNSQYALFLGFMLSVPKVQLFLRN